MNRFSSRRDGGKCTGTYLSADSSFTQWTTMNRCHSPYNQFGHRIQCHTGEGNPENCEFTFVRSVPGLIKSLFRT